MIPKAQLKKADEATPVTLFDSPKLAQQKLIQKLSDLMDERYKKFFLYGALEDKDLVFYFSHNGIAYEFINKLSEFRAKIIAPYKQFNMKETLYFNSIKAKTKHKPREKEESKTYYKDPAKGDFVIEVQDESIRAAFQKLKNTIKESHKEQQ